MRTSFVSAPWQFGLQQTTTVSTISPCFTTHPHFSKSQFSMDVDNSADLSTLAVSSAKRLADADCSGDVDDRLKLVVELRDALVGSAVRKRKVLSECAEIVPRLVGYVDDPHTPAAVSRQCSLVLCSLAKLGDDRCIDLLVSSGAARHLLSCAAAGGDQWPARTAAARALAAAFDRVWNCRLVLSERAADRDMYERDWMDMLAGLLAAWPTAPQAAECAARVLAHTCISERRADGLLDAGVCELLLSAVCSGACEGKLLAAMLGLLGAVCWHSTSACKAVFDYPDMLERLCRLTQPLHIDSIQLEAARIIACVCDAGYRAHNCTSVTNYAVPTLVRLSLLGDDRSAPLVPFPDSGLGDPPPQADDAASGTMVQLRRHAMHTLARLVTKSVALQSLAAENRQCARLLSQRLAATCSSRPEEKSHYAQLLKARAMTSGERMGGGKTPGAACSASMSSSCVAAMTLLSALALNDLEVRRRLAPDSSFLEAALTPASNDDPLDLDRVAAALRCLHSLSRSVEQLRVTFDDRATWKHLLTLCMHEHLCIARLSTAVVCNAALPFSPCRATLVDAGAARVLSDLAGSRDAAVRLNAVWALMNLTYRASAPLKAHVLAALGADKVLLLLCDSDTPADAPLPAKLMGLLRNALALDELENRAMTRTEHIDSMVLEHGQDIIKSVVYVLEGSYGLDVKETALYVLSNVAAGGPASRQLIMANEDVLLKILNYMVAVSSARLQTAAVSCAAALAWRGEPGDCANDDDRDRLTAFGVPRALHQLASAMRQLTAAPDQDLYDKVKLALEQFEPVSME